MDDPGLLILVGAAGLALSALVVWRLTASTFERTPRREGLAAVGLVPVRAGLLGRGVALGIGISALSAAVLSLFVSPVDEDVVGPLSEAAMQPGWHRWLWVLLVLLLGPALEEFVFRGVMLAGLAGAWGPKVAGTVVTVTFTALHLQETYEYLPALLPILLVGYVTYRLRFRTGSILPGLAVHMSYNGVLVVMFLLQEAIL